MGKTKTPRKCSRWHPIHALMAQWAYITTKQLVYMTPARIAQLYQEFKDDTPGNLRELQNEVDPWKAIREMVNVAEKPDTLDNSINQPRPLLQHVHCCHSGDRDLYIDSHGRSPLQRYAALQELSTICALQWQLNACWDWSWCTSTRTQSWMLNPSFITSVVRRTGA